MAKRLLTIELEIEDTDLNYNMPFNTWLFQFLNRLGYEHKVKSFSLDGKKKSMIANHELKALPLREGKDI